MLEIIERAPADSDDDIYIIACDCDGTLWKDAFPEIGPVEPKNQAVIDYIRKAHADGAIVCIWTCRINVEGERNYLDEAVDFCRQHDIPFDYVNDGPNSKGYEHWYTRKIHANVYIDDKAINVNHIGNEPTEKYWKAIFDNFGVPIDVLNKIAHDDVSKIKYLASIISPVEDLDFIIDRYNNVFTQKVFDEIKPFASEYVVECVKKYHEGENIGNESGLLRQTN